MKKLLTYSVVLTTIVWSIGLFAMPLSVSAAAVAGDRIKTQCAAGAPISDSCRTVYYLGLDGRRYVFFTEKIYKTWYPDFNGVVIVSEAERTSYNLGGNVTARPGVKLVKITTDPRVYAVAANGSLREIASEAVAKALYGDNWASFVIDVPDAHFTNYSVGAKINAAGDYDKTAATTAATTISVDKNLAGGGVTPTVPSGTSLKIELAADTAASGLVVGGAAKVPFTKVNLTASADGPITISSWKVSRSGLANDAVFSSVDIIDASTMLTINRLGKTFSSDHYATFNESVTIPAGTTKSFIIAGNMAAQGVLALHGGEVPALGLADLTIGSATKVGNLPITGNTQTVNGSLVIGSYDLSIGAYSNAAQTIEVGKLAYTFLSFKVTANSVEDLQISAVKVYQQGSSSFSDLGNVKLYKDGTEIATGVIKDLDASFSFTPITIAKGQTAQFQVKADVNGGSGRTVILGIYSERDLDVKGLTYTFPMVAGTVTNGAIPGTNPILKDNTATIGPGRLTVSNSSAVGSGNIAVGASQVLGAFVFEAKGEAVDVTNLVLGFTTSTAAATCPLATALTSVKVVNSTGVTVSADNPTIVGPNDIVDSTKQVKYTSTFTVPKGVNIYSVVGTVSLSCNWKTNDTIKVTVMSPDANWTARGSTSGVSLPTITGGSASSNLTVGNQDANLQTVKAANLTVTKNSSVVSSNYIRNTQGILLGSWTFDATNSGEDVRITSLGIRASTTGRMGSLTLKNGTTALDPSGIASPVTSGTNTANATATFALSTPLVVAKGTSVSLSLYGNDDNTSSAGEVVSFGVTSASGVTATGVTTGNNATINVVSHDGALMTVKASGTLQITPYSVPLTSRVYGGSTSVLVDDLKLQATNEDMQVTQFTIHTENGALVGTAPGSSDNFASLYLMKGTTAFGSTSYNVSSVGTQVNLSVGDLTVPQGDTGVELKILANFNSVYTPNNPQTAVSNSSVKVGLWGGDQVIAKGITSQINGVSLPINATGTAMIVNKATPAITLLAGTGGSVAEVDITAQGGDIGIYALTLETNTSTGLQLSDGTLGLTSCGNCTPSSGNVNIATVQPVHEDLATLRLWRFTLGGNGQNFLKIASGNTAKIAFNAKQQKPPSTGTVNVITKLVLDTASTCSAVGTRGHLPGAFTLNNQGDFVWSDLWLLNSGVADGQAQWFNGHGVTVNGWPQSAATSTVQVTVGL